MIDDIPIRALGTYDGRLRRAILALKDGRLDVAQSLGEALSSIVVAESMLVPVPTTNVRRRVRGFDGALMLARYAAAAANAQVCGALMQIAGDAQRGRSRAARLAARGRFVQRAHPGAPVIIVDDVLTTGSTLRDCAATLRAGGAPVQGAVVLALRTT